MATAGPALYQNEPYDTNFSLTARKKKTKKTSDRSLGNISWFAGAMAVAATMVPGGAYAGGRDIVAVADSPGDFFVDLRAHLIEELRHYGQLEAGWDGNEEDIVPSNAAISEAIHFVEKLPPFVALPEPMASNDGEVGLFWHDAELYLDIGFKGNGKCSYFGKLGEEKIKRRDPISEHAPIPAALLDFFVKLSADDKMSA